VALYQTELMLLHDTIHPQELHVLRLDERNTSFVSMHSGRTAASET
jgi:hypothetical protein